jgi:2-polyprenyl-3-methyl-5-hydroxy-6-metoxy-1,4-benzoquinol methylase
MSGTGSSEASGSRSEGESMDENYWDNIAHDFDEEIFDTLRHDRHQVILSYIDRFRSLQSTACDIGCGTGKYLPTLAERFKTVRAIDISAKCLEVAQENCRHLDNVTYFKADLSAAPLRLRRYRFGISVNVLIMPSPETRMAIFRNLPAFIAQNGYLLLVVPSLESALHSKERLLDWNAKSKARHDEAFSIKPTGSKSRVAFASEGVVNLDGTLTKLYLKEELVTLLEQVGFKVSSVAKVEYPWASMFERPPRWMGEPYPWDWLVLCQNKSAGETA